MADLPGVGYRRAGHGPTSFLDPVRACPGDRALYRRRRPEDAARSRAPGASVDVVRSHPLSPPRHVVSSVATFAAPVRACRSGPTSRSIPSSGSGIEEVSRAGSCAALGERVRGVSVIVAKARVVDAGRCRRASCAKTPGAARVRDLVRLRRLGYRPVLVTSGAIACGLGSAGAFGSGPSGTLRTPGRSCWRWGQGVLVSTGIPELFTAPGGHPGTGVVDLGGPQAPLGSYVNARATLRRLLAWRGPDRQRERHHGHRRRSASATTTCSPRRWRSCCAPTCCCCSPIATDSTPSDPGATPARDRSPYVTGATTAGRRRRSAGRAPAA